MRQLHYIWRYSREVRQSSNFVTYMEGGRSLPTSLKKEKGNNIMSDVNLSTPVEHNGQPLKKSEVAEEARAKPYFAINLFLAREFGFLKRQMKKRLEIARKRSTDEEFQQWINAVNDLEMLEQKYQSLSNHLL